MINAGEVKALEDQFAEKKEVYYTANKDASLKEDYLQIKKNLLVVRAAWRAQEEQMGRRIGFVGGDVTSKGQ